MTAASIDQESPRRQTRHEAAILRVEDLTIAPPGSAPLFDNVGFSLHPGEVVLLTGPSGCGKSTLINLLAGTLDRTGNAWKISGKAEFKGEPIDLGRGDPMVASVVFQNFALFDDLSARQNVEIAFDHGDARRDTYAAAIAKLMQGIEPDAAIRDCSGGQQQRIAISRTLVADRPVLFMDEPNSGLDNRAARELALTIRELSDTLGIAIVVIAHHLGEFLDIADRIFAIDPAGASIREIEKPAVDPESGLGRSIPGPAPGRGATSAGRGRSYGLPAREAVQSNVKWRMIRWQSRYFLYYLWLLCLSPSVLLFVGLGGILVGFVSTWFLFQYLPYGELLIPLIQNDALAGIGYIQFRLLVPLMASILIATRNGAIISADIGNRVYSSQPRAMANLAIPYHRYIAGGIVLNVVLGAIILCVATMVLSAWTSMQTWHALFPEQSAYFWREQYFREMWPSGQALPDGIHWVLAKLIPSALGASVISIYFGSRSKTSVIDVNRAIANSIICSVSFVFIWHSLILLVEF